MGLVKETINPETLKDSVSLIGGMLQKGNSEKKSDKVDFSSMPLAKRDSYIYVENGVIVSGNPAYFRVFGKFDYFVKVDVTRRPGLTDSCISVGVYRQNDRKEAVQCNMKWNHITEELDRFNLNIPGSYYECSPRDLGRCVEVKISSLESAWKGDCHVIYGPIQLGMGTLEKLKVLLQNQMLDIKADITHPVSGVRFDRLRATPDQLVAMTNSSNILRRRQQPFPGEEAAIMFPITHAIYTVPSMNDSFSFRIISADDELVCRAKSQDDRDLIIMFIQMMVKEKRREEGQEPLKQDPGSSAVQDKPHEIKIDNSLNQTISQPNALSEPFRHQPTVNRNILVLNGNENTLNNVHSQLLVSEGPSPEQKPLHVVDARPQHIIKVPPGYRGPMQQTFLLNPQNYAVQQQQVHPMPLILGHNQSQDQVLIHQNVEPPQDFVKKGVGVLGDVVNQVFTRTDAGELITDVVGGYLKNQKPTSITGAISNIVGGALQSPEAKQRISQTISHAFKKPQSTKQAEVVANIFPKNIMSNNDSNNSYRSIRNSMQNNSNGSVLILNSPQGRYSNQKGGAQYSINQDSVNASPKNQKVIDDQKNKGFMSKLKNTLNTGQAYIKSSMVNDPKQNQAFVQPRNASYSEQKAMMSPDNRESVTTNGSQKAVPQPPIMDPSVFTPILIQTSQGPLLAYSLNQSVRPENVEYPDKKLPVAIAQQIESETSSPRPSSITSDKGFKVPAMQAAPNPNLLSDLQQSLQQNLISSGLASIPNLKKTLGNIGDIGNLGNLAKLANLSNLVESSAKGGIQNFTDGHDVTSPEFFKGIGSKFFSGNTPTVQLPKSSSADQTPLIKSKLQSSSVVPNIQVAVPPTTSIDGTPKSNQLKPEPTMKSKLLKIIDSFGPSPEEQAQNVQAAVNAPAPDTPSMPVPKSKLEESGIMQNDTFNMLGSMAGINMQKLAQKSTEMFNQVSGHLPISQFQEKVGESFNKAKDMAAGLMNRGQESLEPNVVASATFQELPPQAIVTRPVTELQPHRQDPSISLLQAENLTLKSTIGIL